MREPNPEPPLPRDPVNETTAATPDLMLTPAMLADVGTRPIAIARGDAVFRVEGPGAVDCVQGIFTNDIAKGALPMLRWGAALTPKGMIVTDFWVLRTDECCWLVVPEAGRESLQALLARSFPPRLAKVTDRSAELGAWWLVGGDRIAAATSAAPDGPAPFDRLALVEREHDRDALEAAGFQVAPVLLGDALALLTGRPSLGREIDDKTLPQEVRFDELVGVRYDKGCYVGQETVARVHFRGHPNRTLRAMTGNAPPPADPTITDAGGREVGTIATLAVIGARWIASARLRREIATGDTVKVGGRSAEVREFPIDIGAFRG